MHRRIQIKAVRDCHLRAKFTDINDQELEDKWIDMKAGESRGDIQYVMAIHPEFSDLPDEFDHLEYRGTFDLLKVIHPQVVGETTEAYGVLILKMLS